MYLIRDVRDEAEALTLDPVFVGRLGCSRARCRGSRQRDQTRAEDEARRVERTSPERGPRR